MGPDSLELRSVRKPLSHLNGRIRFFIGPLTHQLAVLQTKNSLPFQNTAFLKPLSRVFSNHVFLVGDKAANLANSFPIQGFPILRLGSRRVVSVQNIPDFTHTNEDSRNRRAKQDGPLLSVPDAVWCVRLSVGSCAGQAGLEAVEGGAGGDEEGLAVGAAEDQTHAVLRDLSGVDLPV